MSFNLLEILGNQVTGVLAKEAGNLLGESEGGITKALGAAFPAILGSVINKGSDKAGAGSLMDLFKTQETGFMDDVSGLFSGGSDKGGLLDTVMGSGGGILKMLMGDKLGGVIDMISKVSGVGSGSTGKLLKMAAPFLIGTIGKQVTKNGLNIGGLMNLLGGQKDHVKAAMPSGLGNLLGFGSLLKGAGNLLEDGLGIGKKAATDAVDLGSKAVGTAARVGSKMGSSAVDMGSDAIDTAAKTGKSLLKWLLPAFLILALLGYLGCKTGCNAVDNAADKAVDVTTSTVEGAADIAKDAANATADGVKAVGDATVKGAQTIGNATADGVKAVGDAAGSTVDAVSNVFGAMFYTINEAGKKALDAMTFTAESAAGQFKHFIDSGAKGDGLFQFENLHFNSGSSTIDAESGKAVDHIAAIMKAYPNVKVRIEGHTDATGDANTNLSLSRARAESVKGRLIGKGIEPERLAAKGFGSTKPLSSTATNDENRRIEVRIVH